MQIAFVLPILLAVLRIVRTQRRNCCGDKETMQAKDAYNSFGAIEFGSRYGRTLINSEAPESVRSRTQRDLQEIVPEENAFYSRRADKSDACFLRFPNAIIVNAQPYERRSRMTLHYCKMQCMLSQKQQPGSICASFVYNNVQQVCDLFAHAGDAAPAWLLDFDSRDYFEPNFGENCDLTKRLPPEAAISTPQVLERDCHKEKREGIGNLLDETEPQPELLEGSCESGKVSRFMRIEGYELVASNEEIVMGTNEKECLEQCAADQIGETPLHCRSFDFAQDECAFSSEVAFPVGEGRLRKNKAAGYYEKVCLEEKMVRSCEMVFPRVPQMTLLGFAEIAADVPSFESCIERCLNSLEVYGFNCTSGMYYFEEKELNCILNAENRNTQSEHFSEEYTDVVDYFEISCRGRFPDIPVSKPDLPNLLASQGWSWNIGAARLQPGRSASGIARRQA